MTEPEASNKVSRRPEDGAWIGEDQPELGPRIYVASLTDYNAGRLHGVWLSAGEGVEVMQEQIDAMLAASPTAQDSGAPAEEWRIDDVDGWGAHIDIGGFESLETIARLAVGLEAHGEAFGAWVDIVGSDDDEALAAFEGHYIGEFGSLTEFGEQQVDDLGFDVSELPGVPEGLRPYVHIDVAAWVRDMELEGAICGRRSSNGIYVFWNY